MGQKRLLWLCLAAFLVAISLVVPVWNQTSNCGGNSAALSQVKQIELIARFAATDAPDHSFRFDAAGRDEREQLAHYASSHWLGGARFLVSRSSVEEKRKQPRHPIVVCNRPYRNVPRQWIGSAPPTHAVAYSDGSCGLISTEEFAALDLSKFTPLDELYPPKSE